MKQNTFNKMTVAAIALLLALLISACSSTETAEQPATTDADTQTTKPVEQPTTAALTAPVEKPEEQTAAAETTPATEQETETPADPYEVTILHAKDNVGRIPTFDAPNGNSITLHDINAVDEVELEYPLEGTTYFGNRLALLVKEFDQSGNWARVQVPVRPNETTVWVQTAFFTQEKHNYRIVVDVSDRTVSVYKGDEALVEDVKAVVGRPSRITPAVSSYIDEKIPGADHGASYGPWILSIAGFSEDIGTFGSGGQPKLAIHGTNKPELIGEPVSSGCVRITNEMIEFIHDTVPVGTVVEINE